MDETTVAAAAVAGVAFGATGLLFGGVAGWLSARAGRAAGGKIGRALAAAVDPSTPASTTTACALEGAVFLMVVGAVIGALCGWQMVPYVVLTLLALVASAVVFGSYAYLLIYRRSWLLAATCGALIGGAAGTIVALGPGSWSAAGALAGILLALARCHRRNLSGREFDTEHQVES